MSDTLTKIGKMLRQAEADGTTPEEAEAFFAAAQALARKNSIDLAVARQAAAKTEKREEPVQRRVSFEASRNTKKHFVNLYHTIAGVNDVQINIFHDSTGVLPFGFPSDIDAVDAIFGSVSIHMVEEANKFIASGKYKDEVQTRVQRFKNFDGLYGEHYDYHKNQWYYWDERVVSKPVDGRTARANFYESYIRTIGRRLREANEKAKAEVIATSDDAGTGTELALIEKATEVADFYKRTSNARGSWNGPSSGGYSSTATHAGGQAAKSARIGASTAVGGKKAIGS